MAAPATTAIRKIGYSRSQRGVAELTAFGCTVIIDCTGGGPDWAALRKAIESLRFGDLFVVWNERELEMPAYVLRDFVTQHGARLVSLNC